MINSTLMYKVFSSILLLFFISSYVCSQTNFRKSHEASDPIPKDSTLNFEEKISIHQQYLDVAIQNTDTLNQIYGLIFLFYDYLRVENFIEAEQYILKAKNLAIQSGNPGWIGWINYREAVIYIRTDNEMKAIECYEKALPLCEIAGDSLCMGECYEQLSALNALIGNFEKANHNFELALPLLEKFGEPKHMCTIYNNYGSLMSMKGKPQDAIPYLELGIDFCKNVEQFRSQAKGMNNLADAYRRLGRYEEAIVKYNKSLKFNEAHNFKENMITNYMGIHICYFEQGDYKNAIDYYIKRNQLKDSISGVKVQEKIASLEAKYESKQKELELQQSKSKTLEYKTKLSQSINIIVAILLILGVWIWYIYKRRIRLHLELEKNKEILEQLTQTLIRKNAGIKTLNDKILKLTNSDPEPELVKETYIDDTSEVIDINQTILTSEDWFTFKSNFENLHKGYILKLRNCFPGITDAEERLFLLLKLKLNRIEIASILGINPDTVKRTRNRLRKKLNLDKQDSLDEFILEF